MKNRTSDKLTALSLAVVLVIVCFLSACQPTPEMPVVVGKGDGLADIIKATPSPSSDVSPSSTPAPNNDALYEKLGVPKHWRFEESALDGKLNLTADVDITLPNVTKLPAATARLSAFTQEDLEKVAALFGAGDATWTQINHTMTKERIEQCILEHQARRATYKAEGDDEMVEKMDEDLEDYAIMYKDAPSEIELKNIAFQIGVLYSGEDPTNGDKQTIIGFEGTTQVNGQPFYFYASGDFNSDNVKWISANFGTGPACFGKIDIDTPYGVSLTKEQAAEQASEIAAQLTDDLSLCYITPAATGQEGLSRNWGWACVFMREIGGCPTAYETTEVGFSLDAVDVPVNYEKMIIIMDDAGMISLEWKVPMTVESIDNPDVSLLSFDEISQRAREQIAQRFADIVSERKDSNGMDWGDPGCSANIIDVKLGLTRVAKVNSEDYYYLPVWKFFVGVEHTEEYYERTGSKPFSQLQDREHYVDEDGKPLLQLCFEYDYAWGCDVITVNALDGSIIDSDLGY